MLTSVGEFRKKTVCSLLAAILILVTLTGIINILPGEVEGAFRYVGSNSTYSTIDEALDNAEEGDIIVLGDGTFNGSFGSDLDSIIIRGNSSANTILVLDGSSNSILTGDGILLNRMTVRNGTMKITGNSFNGTNLFFEEGAMMIIENSTGSNLDNITFMNITGPGLSIMNSSSMNVKGLFSSGFGGEMIKVMNSSQISFQDILHTLDQGSTGFHIIDSTKISISDLLSMGSDMKNTGIMIFDSDSIEIMDSTMEIEGISVNLNSSHEISIKGFENILKGNGSKGINSEHSYNITLDMITQTIEYASTGLETSQTESIEYMRSSLVLEGAGTGMEIHDSSNITVNELEVTGEGDGSCGIRSNGNRWMDIFDMEWTGTGASSIFTEMIDSRNIEINDSLIWMIGESSQGIVDIEGSGVISLHDLDLRIAGQGSIGVGTFTTEDTSIHSNMITISGVSSIGMRLHGYNITTNNNIFTITGEGSTGTIASGQMIDLGADRWFPIGSGTLGVSAMDTLSLSISGGRISSTGDGSGSILLSGTSGTYDLEDLNITGNVDTGTQISIMNPGGVITMENVTIMSNSNEPAMVFSGLRGTIEDSLIFGSGIGSQVDNTNYLIFRDSTMKGSLPIRAIQSEILIERSDMGSSAQSIEAHTNSFARFIDTPVTGISIDPTSQVITSNTISIRVEDRFSDPIPDVDVLLERNGDTIYATEYFDDIDPDPTTDMNGEIGPFTLDDQVYIGDPAPLTVENNLTVYLKGSSGTVWDTEYTLDISKPGTRTIVSPDIDLPNIPGDLLARTLDTREGLLLSWTPNDDDTLEYRIYQLDLEDMSTWNNVDNVSHPSASWNTPDLGPSTRGIFRITAWDGTYESGASNLATGVTLDLTPPEPVESLSLVEVDRDSITISWETSSGEEIGSFELYINGTQGQGMVKLIELEGDFRTYTIDGLAFGTSYSFRIISLDLAGNPSEMSALLEARTAELILTVDVEAYYGTGGPLSELPVFNGTAYLISFNGTVIETGSLDSQGRISFSSLSLDEIYTISIFPKPDYTGEYNVTEGYIPIESSSFNFNVEETYFSINITLPYYWLPITGSIEVSVIYGEGPRTGAVYQAVVDLLDEDDIIVEQKTTDPNGKVKFLIEELPFRGRFHVQAPEGISGSVEDMRTGYLSQTTNYFLLDRNVAIQTFDVELIHYEYIPPPSDLLIVEHSPMGTDVPMDTPIVIKFDQPVVIETVAANVKILPAVAGISFSWDEEHMNLTITHDGLLPEVKYTVRIEWGAMSIENTTFPVDYSSNEWSFTTMKESGEGDVDDNDGISDQLLFAILIGIIIIIIVIGFYVLSSKSRDEEMDDDDVYALSDQDYDEEEEYMDDYQDEEDDLFDDEDEYYDEDYGEDEDYIDDYPEEEDLVEEEEGSELEEEEVLTEEEEIPLEDDEGMEEEELSPEEEEIPDETEPEEIDKQEKEVKKKARKKKKRK